VLLNYSLVAKCTSTTKEVFTFIYILHNEKCFGIQLEKKLIGWNDVKKVVVLDCSYFRRDLLRP